MATDLKALKIEAARAAVEEVRSGMKLGLGTGSTAEEFVKLLGEKMAQGTIRDITAVCTSKATELLAISCGVRIVALEEAGRLDLTVDGADEIDPGLRLIKGRGGALLREKIVEQASERFCVISDYTKEVERLGGVPLPVEVVAFAAPLLLGRFQELGLQPSARRSGQDWYVTDEGHRIVDVRLPQDRDIADVVAELRTIAGVVETGFFPREATEAIIARPDGVVRRTRTQNAERRT